MDATVAAVFLSITRKYLLKLSRLGLVPAHPLGIGARKQWRYRISELRAKVIGSATLSDGEGWQLVGAMKQDGRIKSEAGAPCENLLFSEVASYYLSHKEWKKLSTKRFISTS